MNHDNGTPNFKQNDIQILGDAMNLTQFFSQIREGIRTELMESWDHVIFGDFR